MSKIEDVVEYCKPLVVLCDNHEAIKPDVGKIAAIMDCSGATASNGLKMARVELKREAEHEKLRKEHAEAHIEPKKKPAKKKTTKK